MFQILLEKLKDKLKNKIILGLIVSITVSLLVIGIFQYIPLFENVELIFLNARSDIRYAREFDKKIQKDVVLKKKRIGKSPDISIIMIDDESRTIFGQFPWKRSIYTEALNKFEKGQVSVSLNWWVTNRKPGKNSFFKIYISEQPIKNTDDLKKAKFLKTVKSDSSQVFNNVLIFKNGKYYFAVTKIKKDGTENIFINPGINASKFPIEIKIRKALKPSVQKWRNIYNQKIRVSEVYMPKLRKRIINKDKLAVLNITSKLKYPAAILYDVFFISHKKPENDMVLEKSFSRHSAVYIDYILKDTVMKTKQTDFKERLKLIQKFAFSAKKNHKGDLIYCPDVELPLPEFLKNVTGSGHASITFDSDEITRNIRLIAQYKIKDYPKRWYPSVVLLLAMKYLNVPMKNVEIKEGKYILLKKAHIKTKNVFGRLVNIEKKDIKIPIDNAGRMKITYIGGPNTFVEHPEISSYSFFDKYKLQDLSGKIFMVGLFSTAVESSDVISDRRHTPMGNMFGVEVMANALNTIVTRNFMYQIPKSINYLMVIIIGILLGILLPRFNILKGGLIALGFFIIASFLSIILYNNNYIVNITMPIVSIFLIFLSTSVYKVVVEEKEKKFLKNQFGKYVSEDVVNQILKDPSKIKLGGEIRELTVLFSDIRGFTTISEGMAPDALVNLLNKYLSKMTNVIVRNHLGTLDKYIGDAIMAFWGAPLPHKKHALLACSAAVEMMNELNIFNKETRLKRPLNIGIGINTAGMLVGNMGSEVRMDYTLIGDGVNLGSRLESINKYYKTNIIISEATYEQVKSNVIVRELDLVRVKGKNKPVQIFELIDLK